MLHDQESVAETVHILLVDDDMEDRLAIERYINEHHLAYHLVQTASIAEARTQLASTSFDIAILDDLQRDGTGLEVLAELIDTPAIMLTLSGREAIAAQAMRLGAYDYLIKDTDHDYLTMLPATVRNTLERKRGERQARALQQLHKTILSAIGEGVIGVSWQGNILFANHAAEEILNYPAQTLEGTSIEHLLPIIGWFDSWERSPIYTTCRSGQRYRSDEGCLRRRDGQILPIISTAAPLLDEQGQAFGVVVAFENITDRKLAEAALRASEARFRCLLDAAPDAIVTSDAAGRIVLVNAQAERLFGYQREEMVGQPIELLLPDSFRARHMRHRANYIADARTRPMGSDLKLSARTKDGHDVPVEISLSPLITDGEKLVTAVIRDVRARTKMERALRVSEQRFRMAFNDAPIGMALAKPDGRLLEVNRALCQMLGYTEQELLDQGSPVLTHPDDIPESRERIRQLLAGEIASTTLEKRYIHKQGQVIWTSYTASLLRTIDGRPIYFIFQLQDITARIQAEEALRASEVRLRTVVHNAPLILFALDRAGRYTLTEGRALDSLGSAPNRRVGLSLFEEYPTLTEVHDAVRRALAGEETMAQAVLAGRIFETHYVPERDEQDTVTGVIGVATDITARVQAEEALGTSEQRLQTVVNNAPIVLTAVDAEGRVTFSSGQSLARIGRTPHNTVGQSIFDLLADVPEAIHYVRRTLAGESCHAIIRMRGVVFETHYAPLYNSDGIVNGAVAVSTDITTRMQAEQERRLSEERLRLVVSNAPIMLSAIDQNGIITLSEGKGLEKRRRTAGDYVGRSLFEVHAADAPIVEGARRALAGETVATTAEIAGVAFETRYVPMRDAAGVVNGAIGVSTDVTERVRAEEALRASTRELQLSNAALEQFAYVASHDLQEPLRTITSYLGLLQRRYKGQLDAKADDFIMYAVDGAARMQMLIKAILDYSRIGTRGQPFGSTNCTALMESVTDSLRVAIEETGARLHYTGLPVVWGDAAQLGQLFQNLLGNALKFCHETPEVTITAERQGTEWLFRVCDNGIGIDPAHATQVFEIFKRLHTREEYPGTGIGLAVCKRIVERHGGRIWVESRSGPGTTIALTLPTCDARKESGA